MNIPYMLASDPNNEISKGYGVYESKNLWVRNTMVLRGQHF